MSMYQNINLNTLKYFIEVANTKNITKASKCLNISQPALTKAINQLEQDLNSFLFIRSKKGVSLTPEGEILYQYTKTMFKDLTCTINTINISKQKSGDLYIGATTTNFLEVVLPSLSAFKTKYPEVHIHIILEEIHVLENYNRLGKLDILIKNDYEYMENIELIHSFDIQDCFIVSKNFVPSLEGRVLSLEEILQYPFVLLSNITHGRKNFDSYLKSKGILFSPTYEFNSYSLCKELIKNGFGIGIGNPIHYQEEQFTILKTDFRLPKRNFDVCLIKTSKSQVLKDFIRFLSISG